MKLEPNAAAGTLFSDFSFASGSPFGGTTGIGGVTITLVTDNTEPAAQNSFRDFVNESPAQVTFTFGVPISRFYLDVSRVSPSELLTGFNIGNPTFFSAWNDTDTNTLVNQSGNVTSGGTNDFGLGRLNWTGINTTVVSFTIGNLPNPEPPSPALNVNRFGFRVFPDLEITLIAPERVRISWAADAPDYNLLSAETMSPVAWNVVTNKPFIFDGQLAVELDAPHTQQFFCLRKQ